MTMLYNDLPFLDELGITRNKAPRAPECLSTASPFEDSLSRSDLFFERL